MVEKDLDIGIPADHVVAMHQHEGVSVRGDAITCNFGRRVDRSRDDGSDESVALAHDRFDESGPIRILAERLPYLSDCGIDGGVAIEEHVRAPQRRKNAVASDE